MAVLYRDPSTERVLYNYGDMHRLWVEGEKLQPEYNFIYGNPNNWREGWFKGTGPSGWPPYRMYECVDHLRSSYTSDSVELWQFEEVELWQFENESQVECAVHRGGIYGSFCMPRYGISHEELVQRYRAFYSEGCLVIYYFDSGNYSTDKKVEAKKAAEEAGISLLILDSSKIWKKFRLGGCFDDIFSTIASDDEDSIDIHMTEFLNQTVTPEKLESLSIKREKENFVNRGGTFLPNPDPSKIKIEIGPTEPEKAKNVSFYKERIDVISAPEYLGSVLRADHELPNAWRYYDGSRWVSHHSNDKVHELLEDLYDRWGWQIRDIQTINNDTAGLRRALGSDVPSSKPDLLPFTNGCLDLKTKKLLPHYPINGNRYCLPFDYKPNQGKPKKTLAFLKDRLVHDETIMLYCAFVWHILTGNSLKAFLEITGPGNTGKSVLTNLLIAFIGIENTVSCSLRRIEDASNRFETHRMRNKRLAVFSESQAYSGPLEMLKALTGGDRIPCERKNSNVVLDFVFSGGVVLTGNAPVRSSDTSGAVINRRRSLIVDKVVEAKEERSLIEFDGFGGLRGELVPELSAFVDHCLAMTPAEAKQAIARDVAASSRADAEKQILLATDHLATWANECLIFDNSLDSQGKPTFWQRVGTKETPKDEGLLANYQVWIAEREQTHPYGMRTFKHKLVDLLRDTIRLPLPHGDHQKGSYRIDGIGSVVPFVRFRRKNADDQLQGVIDAAFAKRFEAIDIRVPNDENPDNNGTYRTNGF